jgi:hypothetical protein
MNRLSPATCLCLSYTKSWIPIICVATYIEWVEVRGDSHNGQKKKYKRTNNDLQNNTNKAKNRVIDMKRKFKHWRSTSRLISTERTITPHLNSFNIGCDTYDGNPALRLGQTQTGGRTKPIHRIPRPFLIVGSPTTIHIYTTAGNKYYKTTPLQT